MNFNIGKKYIVDVTSMGIIPIEEFTYDRYFDRDNDDLDFLTDEEKSLLVKDIINKLRAEMVALYTGKYMKSDDHDEAFQIFADVNLLLSTMEKEWEQCN